MFVLACQQLLQIQKPVEIRIIPGNGIRDKVLRNSAGLCDTFFRNGKLNKHILYVNLRVCVESKYTVEDVIAHEFVHAVMIENGKFNPNFHHDKTFQNICKVFEENLNQLGFKVGELYNPQTDTD